MPSCSIRRTPLWMEQQCEWPLRRPRRQPRLRLNRPKGPDMQAAFRAATVIFLGILGACSLAPTYSTPGSPSPADAYAEAADWHKAEPLDDGARGAWWTMFQDPTLAALEVKVSNANQNIKAAFARLQEARAATRIAHADLLPTLNVGASSKR